MKSLIISILLAMGVWASFNLIYNQNKTIEAAYDAYMEKDYQEVIDHLKLLSDSLDYENDGVQLDIAHSTYQLNGFSGPNGTNFSKLTDSVYLSQVQSSFYEYTRVWEAEPILSSKGYHQAGMVTFKSRIINNQLAEEAQLITSAMDYFKNALKKDPYNEKARYNYEILKKYKEFPEMLMERVRRLVEQRLYLEAYTILGPYAEKDSRFSGYKDYAKRLGDIVNIETQANDS